MSTDHCSHFMFTWCGSGTRTNPNRANLLKMTCFLVFQVYKVCSDTFDIYDQHYGRGLVKDTIIDGTCDCL